MLRQGRGPRGRSSDPEGPSPALRGKAAPHRPENKTAGRRSLRAGELTAHGDTGKRGLSSRAEGCRQQRAEARGQGPPPSGAGARSQGQEDRTPRAARLGFKRNIPLAAPEPPQARGPKEPKVGNRRGEGRAEGPTATLDRAGRGQRSRNPALDATRAAPRNQAAGVTTGSRRGAGVGRGPQGRPSMGLAAQGGSQPRGSTPPRPASTGGCVCLCKGREPKPGADGGRAGSADSGAPGVCARALAVCTGFLSTVCLSRQRGHRAESGPGGGRGR